MKTTPTKREQYLDLFRCASGLFDGALRHADCEGDVDGAAYTAVEALHDLRRVIAAQADSQEPTPEQ